MKGIIRKTSMLGVSLLLGTSLFAQSKDSVQAASRDYTRGWYVGVQAGMPMAEGTFSSFGADKFRLGWSAGIHAGYRFTPVWSLEMTANWGQQFLAEQDCCFERGYFLGIDHNRYRASEYINNIPTGMGGWYYTDLKSRTFVQRYGLQVNMNILGFFNRTRDSRWRLDISPVVYAVGTSSDLMTKADNTPVADNLNDWHLGYGGQAQVSYAVAQNMNIGIYGGFAHLTGKPMDGMPELHSTNFIIDAGVKFSFAFGAKKRAGKSAAAVVPAVIAPVVPAEQPREDVKELVTPPVEKADSVVTVADTPKEVVAVGIELKTENGKVKTETEVKGEEENVKTEEVLSSDLSVFSFPVIYFSFNSVWIEPNERAKVEVIADMMKADESIRISITGWGDAVSGEEANRRVSLQRAEAIKAALIKRGIDGKRIETVGGGINRDAKSNAEARIAATTEALER